MIERHTFKKLISSVVEIEAGIAALEKTLACQFDNNWMIRAPETIIRAIAEGFLEKVDVNSLEEDQADIIEELLYHFIYMEDCGNESEHCKYKLVIVNEGKEDQHSVPCTNLDELYNVIILYLENTDCDFTFNYCHATQEDKELKDAR